MMDVGAVVSLATAFVCVAIASYTDLTKREIPDKLPWIMIALGIGLNTATGLRSDILLPLYSGASALFAFAIGLLLWKAGAVAGGDVKFYAGLAAILPSLGFLRFPLLPLALLLISMAAFVVYTLIHTMYHMARGVSPAMRRVKINMLQEGMVPGEYVFKDGLAVKRSPYGRGHPCPNFTEIYADPRGMEGLTKEQIAKLEEALGGDDKLWVRRTHAFVPFFAVGLVVMLILVII